MDKYIVPSLKDNFFTCPYCNVLSQQKNSEIEFYYNQWNREYAHNSGYMQGADSFSIVTTTCQSCKKYHIWVNGRMIIPSVCNIVLPLDDMPIDIKDLYNEAREVFPHSPKATAALLRLALQKLCIHLGEKGGNINDDIASLVKKGLPKEVQMALDYIRVTGNNAVHPGEMDIEDDEDICLRLFSMLNFIVDKMIIQPKEVVKAFDFLPDTAKKAIDRRDNK